MMILSIAVAKVNNYLPCFPGLFYRQIFGDQDLKDQDSKGKYPFVLFRHFACGTDA